MKKRNWRNWRRAGVKEEEEGCVRHTHRGRASSASLSYTKVLIFLFLDQEGLRSITWTLKLPAVVHKTLFDCCVCALPMETDDNSNNNNKRRERNKVEHSHSSKDGGSLRVIKPQSLSPYTQHTQFFSSLIKIFFKKETLRFFVCGDTFSHTPMPNQLIDFFLFFLKSRGLGNVLKKKSIEFTF